jgi:hypothetical protein
MEVSYQEGQERFGRETLRVLGQYWDDLSSNDLVREAVYAMKVLGPGLTPESFDIILDRLVSGAKMTASFGKTSSPKTFYSDDAIGPDEERPDSHVIDGWNDNVHRAMEDGWPEEEVQ